MATISWRGGSGRWSSPTSWSLSRQPATGDSVVFAGTTPYGVTLDGAGAARDVSLAAGATLDITGTLDLGGTLGGAGALVLAGIVSGGTLDLTHGSAGGSGTLEGVTLLGSLATLSGLSIDTATALDTAGAASGTLALGSSVALQSGLYDVLTIVLGAGVLGAGGATSARLTAAGAVTFGPNADVELVQNANPVLDGGSFLNQGTIASKAGSDLTIAAASFSNAGLAQFATGYSTQSNLFIVGHHLSHGQQVADYGVLTWSQATTPTVSVSSSQFTNSGSIYVDGGRLQFVAGQTVDNSGLIVLGQVNTQQVVSAPDGTASVVDALSGSQMDIGASVTTFTNTGTIFAADFIFEGAVSLAALGILKGGLQFSGTLDLGGGTLDASAYGSVEISGTVENGTLAAGTGTLTLAGATLANVAVLPGGNAQSSGQVTLIDPPAGPSITLDATTTRLDLSAGTTSDATVVAGSTLALDAIQLRSAGTATLGAGFSLTAAVAGSTVDIGDVPGATVLLNGSIAVDAATLRVTAMLDGAGTLSLADGAAVTLDALAVTAAPNFTFGAGAALLVLPGSGVLGATLSGLHVGDVVDFLAVSSIPNGQFGAGGAAASQGALDITGASGDSASVGLSGPIDGLTFQVAPDGNGGSLVEVACFAAGTRVATPGGATAVETLRPGDVVVTASGRVAPVRWVGCTTVDLVRHRDPARAAPIRIAAGAVAPGRPLRDLWVSPEHCLLVDGVLIPAVQLVNGASIARDDGFARVAYWHVELDRHDVLLVEGLPAESYLDTGNRALFAGHAGSRPLHPDLAGPLPAAALAVWAARGCAPLLLAAELVRERLRRRAAAAGWTDSADAGLTVLADGVAVPWQAQRHDTRVRLPAATRSVRLVSRSFVPSETQPTSGDTRRLGVAVQAILLADWPLHPDCYADGWHAAAGEGWRWTRGDAGITLPKLAHATWLTLRNGPPGCYRWRLPSVGAGVGSARRAA